MYQATTQEADSLARSHLAGPDATESNAENTAPGILLLLKPASGLINVFVPCFASALWHLAAPKWTQKLAVCRRKAQFVPDSVLIGCS